MPTPLYPRQLIVEGESDRSFFEVLLRHLQLKVDISVVTPRDLRGGDEDKTRNTKRGVITRLNGLINDLQDGKLVALGVVVDADHSAQDAEQSTFEKTRAELATALAKHGYDAPQDSTSHPTGLIAIHNDGQPPVGMWVMPDNASAGSLEDWIIRCRHPNEEALWQHAQQAINTLPGGPRFNPLTQRAKADVATWLAWQKKPGEERYMLVKSLQQGTPLLDEQAPLYQGLCHWLKQVFAEPDAPPA